jgi:uncharacterized protein
VAGAYEKPLPALTKVNAEFWAGTRAGELRLQRCARCGTVRYPPGTHCPSCLSREHAWETMSGRGRIWSWTVFWQQYFKAFADDIPYVVALVRLDEGPLLTTSVVGIAAEELRCDLPVKVTFRPATEEMCLPVFEPA